MESRKRSIDHAFRQDGEEDPTMPCPKTARKETDVHHRTLQNLAFERQEAFEEFLANTVPLGMIDPDVKQYLIEQSNDRLDRAREESVDIEDITIGPDCLPVWSTYYWDPSVEPLHSIVQRRLDDLEVSQMLGKLVREDIITKSNKKLEAARDLGLSLDDIIIGNSLLPEILEPMSDEDDYRRMNENEYDTQSSSRTLTPSSPPTTLDPDPEDNINRALWDTFASSYISFADDSDSDNSSSDKDSKIDDNLEEDHGLYHVTLNNFVDDQAYFSDGSVDLFHSAHVVGAPQGYSDIDLEVYAATEDDEVEHLPEMEFTIDRAAFYHYFETDEGVDVEVPGVYFRCDGEIVDPEDLFEDVEAVEAVEVVEENSNEDHLVPLRDRKVHFAHLPTIIPPSPTRSSPSDTSGAKPVQNSVVEEVLDDSSVASEEMTSDEDEDSRISEEVDGVFTW